MSHTVLLVEDDRAIATVITEALREEGFEITACTSIERRDALLGESCFDVMLTDIMLEDGDGLDGMDTVRAAAPHMPVIVLSAQNTLDTAVRLCRYMLEEFWSFTLGRHRPRLFSSALGIFTLFCFR